MVIKYRLGFADKSEDYAYLCSQILEKLNAKFNVVKTDDEIIIFIEGEEEEIKTAFVTLGESLPLSLYLNSQSVEDAIGLPQNKVSYKKVSYLTMFPSISRELVDDNSPFCFDVFGLDIGLNQKNIALDEVKISSKDALKKSLEAAVKELSNGKKLLIKNEKASFCLSTTPNESVFLTNLKSDAMSEFLLTNDDILSLSAMERPVVLKFKDEKFVSFAFANDAIVLLLAKVAAQNGINALYITNENGDSVLEYSGFLGDVPSRKALYFAGADRFFVNTDFTANNTSLINANSLFFNMNSSNDFAAYAINENKNAKKLLSADFFASNPIEGVAKEFDFGEKLSANFKKAFPNSAKALEDMKFSGEAIRDFFDAVAVVLGKNDGFNSVMALTDSAEIAGGVKLDFTLQKKDSETVAGLKKCFASILSYKLAGVEDNILAYSVFESAVDFIVSTLDEAKKSFTPTEIFVGGDFLLSKIFVSKLKSKVKTVNINMALNTLPANLQKSFEIVS